MRVLVVPLGCKGTFTAARVADATAGGAPSPWS